MSNHHAQKLWTPRTAERLAHEAGIGPLTDRHWKVIALCREEAARYQRVPDLQRICELAGMDEAELGQLFPGDPGRLSVYIAGLSRTGAADKSVSDEEA